MVSGEDVGKIYGFPVKIFPTNLNPLRKVLLTLTSCTSVGDGAEKLLFPSSFQPVELN